MVTTVMQWIKNTEELLEDMELAWEAERPVRTRSDLAEIPILGGIFQVFCDASDFVSFNAGLARRYVPAIPALAAIPTVLSCAGALKSAVLLPSTMVALVSWRRA